MNHKPKKYQSARERWEGGKGSRRRPTDEEKYRENYDRIFKKDTDVPKEAD